VNNIGVGTKFYNNATGTNAWVGGNSWYGISDNNSGAPKIAVLIDNTGTVTAIALPPTPTPTPTATPTPTPTPTPTVTPTPTSVTAYEYDVEIDSYDEMGAVCTGAKQDTNKRWFDAAFSDVEVGTTKVYTNQSLTDIFQDATFFDYWKVWQGSTLLGYFRSNENGVIQQIITC
jgi:hypothetical protein